MATTMRGRVGSEVEFISLLPCIKGELRISVGLQGFPVKGTIGGERDLSRRMLSNDFSGGFYQ
jgi:hypothetical protein